MQYHILNGDALKIQFPQKEIPGQLIIAKECLIVGPVKPTNTSNFWQIRKNYLTQSYGNLHDYDTEVRHEFEKIKHIDRDSEIHLWFEEDLFCVVNMWFSVHLILAHQPTPKVSWIKPKSNNWWGFGGMSPEELVDAYVQKIPISNIELQQLNLCWEAFQRKDFSGLKRLAASLVQTFPQIEAVVQAHIDRFPENEQWGRPEKRLSDILKAHSNWSFGQIFRAFNETEGIYGFGDLQVKELYQKVKRYHDVD